VVSFLLQEHLHFLVVCDNTCTDRQLTFHCVTIPAQTDNSHSTA
jgi:hypothetical protein